jgi:hypothetical protein
VATAPVAPKQAALAQLDAAVPVLESLFAADGRLGEPAALWPATCALCPGSSREFRARL